MGECSVTDCDRTATRRGWCNSHYMRWWKFGDVGEGIPLAFYRPTADTLEDAFRFYMPGEPPEVDCWEWTGLLLKPPHLPYGRLTHKQKFYRAHIVAYQVFNGEVREGQVVRHTCDNPPCVNPHHLLVGTDADNSRDMVDRGRSSRGELHAHAKLTDEIVLEIRARLESGEQGKDVAARYGISRAAVSRIGSRKTWRHL